MTCSILQFVSSIELYDWLVSLGYSFICWPSADRVRSTPCTGLGACRVCGIKQYTIQSRTGRNDASRSRDIELKFQFQFHTCQLTYQCRYRLSRSHALSQQNVSRTEPIEGIRLSIYLYKLEEFVFVDLPPAMSHFVSQPWFLLSIPAVWVTAILPEVYKVRAAFLTTVMFTNLPI